MNKKHEPFLATMLEFNKDSAVTVIAVDTKDEIVMAVCTLHGPIFITKQQAMEFFNLRSNE